MGNVKLPYFADGMQVENWWSWDMLGLMQQLGVIPGPGE
jgi:uncharacterized protein YqcC (DUF446 family)